MSKTGVPHIDFDSVDTTLNPPMFDSTGVEEPEYDFNLNLSIGRSPLYNSIRLRWAV